MSPVPSRERVPEYRAKASELLGRSVGLSQELRQARRLHSPQGSGHKVMFMTPRSWSYHVQTEAVLAHALRLRGAEVSFLGCAGGLEICDRTNTWESPPPPCRECTSYVRSALRAHDLPMDPVVGVTTETTDWPELDTTSVADLHLVEADGVPLGRLVEVALRWFLMDSRVDGDPLAPQTARRFLRAARQVARSLRVELEMRRPDTVVLLNGRFFFESIAAHIASSLGIDVVTYERGFLPHSLFVKRGEPACLYDVGPAAWSKFEGVELTPEESDRLDDYIEDRRAGRTGFWSYWDDPTTDVPAQASGVRRVGLFTNLTWDSAVIGRGRACDSIQHWLDTVIAAAAERAPHEFVIRIHPAERKLAGKQTREPILGYLREAHPGGLPPNVRVIGPEDPLSSYALMSAIDIGMVFTSTTGLELVLSGVPTIAAGAPHYGGRGFTADPADPAALIDDLDAMLEAPERHRPDIALARRYAYLCWFRASLPFPYVEEPYRGLSRLTVGSLDDLRPGRSADLDHLCDVLLGQAEPVRP